MNYDFEWDAQKAGTNLRKHGISFEQATGVFLDPLAITVYDEAHSESEERWHTLGTDGRGNLLVVSHTFRTVTATNAIVRIISARPATRREQSYYSEIPH